MSTAEQGDIFCAIPLQSIRELASLLLDHVESAALQLYGKVLFFLFEGWGKGCDSLFLKEKPHTAVCLKGIITLIELFLLEMMFEAGSCPHQLEITTI